MSPFRTRFLSFFLSFSCTYAQFISIQWSNCSAATSTPNSPNQIAVSAVYAQLVDNPQLHLNYTVFGSASLQITGESGDATPFLDTVFTTTSRLTFTVSSTTSAFCDSLLPPSPLPELNATTNNYCPVSAGDIAFSVSSPLNHKYELLSLNTRIKVVDSSSPALQMLCLDLSVSPLDAGLDNSVYGTAVIAFWVTVSITIAFWFVVGLGRIASAWNRGQSADQQKFWSHFQRVGFVVASAISGEKFSSEPALLRFCTPTMRDVLYHTQWCAALGMIAVQWPPYAYPIFAQAAWSALVYNITLTQGSSSPSLHWNPLSTPNLPTPQGFADQISNASSPIFIDPTVQNSLFSLPPNTQAGIESFAFSVGIRPQDLFGISVGLFLIISGGVIAFSLILWAVDSLFCTLCGISDERRFLPVSQGNRRWSLGTSDAMIKAASRSIIRDSSDDVLSNPRTTPSSRGTPQTLKAVSWAPRVFRRDTFHRDALCGNLIRVLYLFHLPITIFSAYEFSRPRRETNLAAIILAALTFVLISVFVPSFLILRVSITKTKKLFDDTRTLLTLGPLYNQYAAGSQTFATLYFASNIALAVVIGCGHKSGTTQAIIVLVVEVIAALWTSIYLPWGRGAAMGTLSFLMCVFRIITAVLLVILSPTVAVGVAAGSWIAAAILLIQAIIYGLFFSLLAVKIVEGFLRLIYRIPFNRSRHAVDAGVIGVLGLAGIFGRRHRKHAKTPRYKRGIPSSQSVLGEGSSETPRVSTPSRGPASVLRVEQIGTPYTEDGDDEAGHILGAWPPLGEAVNSVEAPGPSQPKSGFTRVRGGRANFDSPYAIMPAVAEADEVRAQFRAQIGQSTSPPLPPGAMKPSTAGHLRNKSETGIIGDFASLQSQSTTPSRLGFHAERPSVTPDMIYPGEDEDEDENTDYPPRRALRWFGRRTASSPEELKRIPWSFIRGRTRSERDEPDPSTVSMPLDSTTRSFVVVRNKVPGSNRPAAS